MIVADASAVVELVLTDPVSPGVRAAFTDGDELHAPEILDLEVLHVARRWARRGGLSGAGAEEALRLLGGLPIRRHRHGPLRSRAWALRDRCSAYDAAYVALAEALDAELLTADARLARAADGLVPVRLIG